MKKNQGFDEKHKRDTPKIGFEKITFAVNRISSLVDTRPSSIMIRRFNIARVLLPHCIDSVHGRLLSSNSRLLHIQLLERVGRIEHLWATGGVGKVHIANRIADRAIDRVEEQALIRVVEALRLNPAVGIFGNATGEREW